MANVISNQDCDRALKQLAEGDITALSEIYHGTARLIFSLALSLLGNREDAEDVLQDTMVEVVKSVSNYQTGSPKAWVLSIARNRAMYTLRKRRPTADEEEPSSLDPEFEKIELLDLLNSLSEAEKQTVFLHIYCGLSHKEIGDILNISPAAAHKKYRRALSKLKDFL